MSTLEIVLYAVIAAIALGFVISTIVKIIRFKKNPQLKDKEEDD